MMTDRDTPVPHADGSSNKCGHACFSSSSVSLRLPFACRGSFCSSWRHLMLRSTSFPSFKGGILYHRPRRLCRRRLRLCICILLFRCLCLCLCLWRWLWHCALRSV